MRLTDWTDYTLRVLMYCGAQTPERLVTIAEMAQNYGISRHHLTKIVNQLAHQGLIATVRGRSGGVRLAQPAAQINLGAVVRAAEPDFRLVECFDKATNTCPLTTFCQLKRVLHGALNVYLAELDKVTLADLLPTARSMGRAMAWPKRTQVQAVAPRKASSATTRRAPVR